jgi:ATP-binding cassette subfamily B protein
MRGGMGGGFERSLGGMGRTYGLMGPRPGHDRGAGDVRRVPLERALLMRVYGYFRPYRFRALLVLACLGATSLLGLVAPLLVRAILDQALPSRNIRLLTWLVLGLVAAPLASGLIGVLQNYVGTVISQALMFDLRNALYCHLQKLSLRFYTTTRAGEILSRVNNDVNAVQHVVLGTVVNVVTNLVTVVATATVLFAMDWRLALLACAIVPAFLVPTRRVGRIRHRLARETQEKQSELLALMQDVVNIGGFILMRLFGQASYEEGRFRVRNREVMDLHVRQAMVGRWMLMFFGVFAAAGPALIYWYGGRRVILEGPAGGITVGTIIAFVAYLSNLYRPTSQLASTYVDLQAALAVFARIFDYLDLKPDVEDRPGARALGPAQGRIAFEGVTFSYREDRRPALRDVSFEVRPGQLAALVGPSGAGKTTATYLVPRFYDPQAGCVRVDGHDIRELTQESLMAQIGMVTQETFLFHATVRENLLYARRDATQAQLEAAARAAHIHEVIVRLPDGYDTLVGERGFKLSGGERQRLSIARAVLKDPRILILDEATSSLDSESEAAIQAALEPLMRGRTSLVIAHRLSTVLAADLILVFEEGHLVEQGRHPDLLAGGGLYARLFHTQFSRAIASASPPSERDCVHA